VSLKEQLEQEVADRILADPLFATVEVLVDPEKNVVEEVQRKIALLNRLVAPVVNGYSVLHPDVFGPYFDSINLDIGVFHNPKIAGAGPSPSAMAERVAALLHLWKPDSLSVPLKCEKDAITAVPDEKLNIWSVKVSASGGLTYVLPQVAPVTAAQVGNEVQLACATHGAAIFFTTDGKHPTPRNGTYFGEGDGIQLEAATTIKARAWLAGYLASDLYKQSFNPV
jgi:hypothetical protein